MKTIFTPVIIFLGLLTCGNMTSRSDQMEASPSIAPDTTINFESGATGQIPGGFISAFTGTEQIHDWKTVDDKGNKVAAQLARNKGNYFNMLVLNKQQYKDFSMSVKIKAVSGNEDQGGGLVWRYVDNNNYYTARYNPLENNLRFYRVVNGNRKQLESVTSEIPSGVWFTLSVEMMRDKISCSLNSEKLIEATDDTFPGAGQVGLWTKADAVTYFDDLAISPQ